MTTTKSSIEQYWKDDFIPLEAAGKVILRELREDEAQGDLHRRILSRGSHLYSSSNSDFKHAQSIPLPQQLMDETRKVKTSLFMGILPEANLAWMSVDHKLFLWSFEEGKHLMNLEVRSGQNILSVGLAPPKAGVFKETVEWCLIVTTSAEMLLCALQRQNDIFSLVQTRYNLSTDSVPIVSLCGLPNGRIFMGGHDGSLFEFTYESSIFNDVPRRKTPGQALDDFYDGASTSYKVSDLGSNIATKYVREGKRALITTIYGSERPRKCRKLDHSSNGFKAVTRAIFPDWLRKISSDVFLSEKSGPLVKIVHDAERNCLHTLSARGFIFTYDLRGNELTLKATLDCDKISRQYLSAVFRGLQYVTSPSIEFGGGGAAAQAGVGGKEGAHAILRLADTGNSNILIPIAIHVLPRSESSRLTLLAITKGGLRYYLTTLSSSLDKSNLAPSSRIVLSHIRAPPPVDSTTGICKAMFDEDNIPGGMLPEVFPQTKVDATAYSDGHLFLALQNPEERNIDGRQEVGDVIVGTNTDLVARKITRQNGIAHRELPGGLSETVSIPSSLLPGGIIYDASAYRTLKHSSVMKLMLNSQTPSNSELSVGLVPPFYPKAIGKNDTLKKEKNGSNTALVAARPTALFKSNGITVSGSVIAMQVMKNFFLSRPLGSGLEFGNSYQKSKGSREPLYRLSKCYGTSGFSFTASEKVNSGLSIPRSTKTKKSARLSSWLLRPAMIPLNDITLNHILPCTSTIAVNLSGLHFFQSGTRLQTLSEVLMSAGPDLASDNGIIAFFNDYGAKQFCTMCLTLGIGCGPAKGNSSMSEELKRRAKRAAFDLGGRPHVAKKTLFDNVASDAIVVENNSLEEELVPKGYEFSPSNLSAGLTSVLSRLLRPIWFKPAVVVTEGPIKNYSAKVEFLLDESTLAEVRSPLFSLKNLMKEKFRRAVEVVPGIHKNDINQMEIDETSVLTGSMRFQGALRHRSTSSGMLSNKEAVATARLIEERNIHSAFRLLSRVVQLLDLLSLLRRAQEMPDLPEIEWGLLHGVTISQLVQSGDGQERIESLLNSLVSSSSSNVGTDIVPTADSDSIATSLANGCYLFFSPGSRFAYLGFRAAKEALGCMENSTRRVTCANQSVGQFKMAATFWTNTQLITGRLMHGGEIETYEQKAQVALRYDSPLARAASILLQLREYVAIVDICTITASNFNENQNALTIVDNINVAYPWEKMLYHHRKAHTPSARDSTNGTGTASEMSTNSIVLGTSVTPQDAISTCHAIILYNLLALLNGPSTEESKRSMVSACAASSDKKFLLAFFQHLTDERHKKILLKIDSQDLEKWLKESNDHELLWQYYVAQQKYTKAGVVMWEKATEVNVNISIQERIRCLERSQSSYTSAIATIKNQLNHTDSNNLQDVESKRLLVAEHLDIARLQFQTLNEITSMDIQDQLNIDATQRLKNTLVKVSDLYNDYAAKLNLFDVCLRIMLSCRHNKTEVIETLWRSIICQELLPCKTTNDATYNFLTRLANASLIDEKVVFLPEESDQSLALFESGEWLEQLKSKIEVLGKDLIGKGADYVCPIPFLVSVLEGLRHATQDYHSAPWPLHLLVKINVSFPDLLDAYESIIEREEVTLMGGADPHRRYLSLRSVVELLEEWISAGFSGGNQNRAYQELSNAVVTKSLLSEIDALKSRLDDVGEGREDIQTRLNRVKESIQRL